MAHLFPSTDSFISDLFRPSFESFPSCPRIWSSMVPYNSFVHHILQHFGVITSSKRFTYHLSPDDLSYTTQIVPFASIPRFVILFHPLVCASTRLSHLQMFSLFSLLFTGMHVYINLHTVYNKPIHLSVRPHGCIICSEPPDNT